MFYTQSCKFGWGKQFYFAKIFGFQKNKKIIKALFLGKIISILDLKNKNTYTLYELDKNEEIQNKIMELIPEIRKWFSFNGLKAVGEPSKIKRPWLIVILKKF